MSAVFADTIYYFALLNPGDHAHADATKLTATLRGPIVTTAWVLTELADGLATTPSRNLFAPFFKQLQSIAFMTIVPPTELLFADGVRLFDARSDKQWSLTDCVSMVVMKNLGITEVLTGDHHFRQAGFNTLFPISVI